MYSRLLLRKSVNQTQYLPDGVVIEITRAVMRNAADMEERTELMIAAKQDNVELCRLLIENGASVNAADREGRTVLMIAAKKKNMELCRLLMDNGAAVNAVDVEGCTVLHYLARPPDRFGRAGPDADTWRMLLNAGK